MNQIIQHSSHCQISALRTTALIRLFCSLVPFLLSFPCSAVTHGQPVGSHRDSLEWMIARADAIVQGPVESVVPLNPDHSYLRFHQVTVKTQTVIAGQAEGKVCFVIVDPKPYINLKQQDHEGLFFLVRSPSDFNRQRHDYFYSRCPVLCKNMIDLGDETASVTSFDVTGLRELEGSKAILARVEHYLETFQRGGRRQRYMLREPDGRAYTGYDSLVTVPLDHYRLHTVAKKWLAKGGVHSRVARDIENVFSELIDFEAAKAKYAAERQVPTDWHRANTLSIDSLEWMASDSDVIVRGTIEDLVLVKLGDRDSKESFEASLDQHVVKLRVNGQIKGEVDPTISFVVNNGGKLSEWQRKKIPLVVFLKDRGMQVRTGPMRLVATVNENQTPILRYAGRGTDTKAILAFDEGHPKMFSARLTWIDDPHEMLAIVRDYLALVPTARESGSRSGVSVSFEPPATFLKGTEWEGDRYVRMKFPIDAYLEKQARRWIVSDLKEARWLGAYALVYFKSEENAKALKRLLDDPGKWAKPKSFSKQKVTYMVRWEAWTILHAWGIDVPRPSFSDS